MGEGHIHSGTPSQAMAGQQRKLNRGQVACRFVKSGEAPAPCAPGACVHVSLQDFRMSNNFVFNGNLLVFAHFFKA